MKTNCAYMTRDGRLFSSNVESLWYTASEDDLLNLIITGESPTYPLDAPGVISRENLICEQPILAQDIGNAVYLSYDHAGTGQAVVLTLTKSTLHYMSWLCRFRDGPNSWGLVHRVFQKLGLNLPKRDLAVIRFLSAISNPSLIQPEE